MLVGLSRAEGKERPQSMQRKRYVAEASNFDDQSFSKHCEFPPLSTGVYRGFMSANRR